MKLSMPFVLIVIIFVISGGREAQSRKGCNAYGHACLGGHGKRSLNSYGNDIGSYSFSVGNEQSDENPDAFLQIYPKDTVKDVAPEIYTYPRYRLIQIIKAMCEDQFKRLSQRVDNDDRGYLALSENFNGDNINKYD